MHVPLLLLHHGGLNGVIYNADGDIGNECLLLMDMMMLLLLLMDRMPCVFLRNGDKNVGHMLLMLLLLHVPLLLLHHDGLNGVIHNADGDIGN